eukprot:366573-Chlamydomonas_euryale.AAC.22
MLSVLENAGVALAPKDARDRCPIKRADGKYVCNLCTTVFAKSTYESKLHSNVLGDGSNQTAPCQGPVGF